MHDGGPRTAPRSPHTARAYRRAALPALLDWSARYDHLREVTRDDVLGYIAGLYGHERRQAVSALRSLFTWAKKADVIFRSPATRIRLAKREHAIWQPLTGRQLARGSRCGSNLAGTPVPGPGRCARGKASCHPGAATRRRRPRQRAAEPGRRRPPQGRAEVFDISEHTAIRYATNARHLLGPAHQAAAPSSTATPRKT